jgi:hypothetical protein
VNFSFFRDAHAAFEQPDFVWSVREKPLGVSRMLLSENLGWCHERGLIAILDSGEHRHECDDRFSAADITWSRRFMGASDVISPMMRSMTRSCADVSWNGAILFIRSRIGRGISITVPFGSF